MFSSFRRVSLVLLVSASCALAQTRPSETLKFQSKQHGMSFSYSGTYHKMPEETKGVIASLMHRKVDERGTRANIVFAIPETIRGDNANPLKLQSAYDQYLVIIRGGLKGSQIIQQGDTEMGGHPAKFAIIKGHHAESYKATKVKYVISVRDNLLYAAVGISEPEVFELLEKNFDDVLASLEWTEKSAATQPAEGAGR